MPARRKRVRQGPSPHLYSVWVNGETGMNMVYMGGSESQARTALGRAIMNNRHAVSVEIRRDLLPWLNVLIERKPL